MKNSPQIICILCWLLISVSCKKSNEDKPCWKVPSDTQPGAWTTICNKTESEIQEQYLVYYRADEPLYCWYLTLNNGYIFITDYPESLINKLYSQYTKTKVNCDYCSFWYNRIKRIYKPNNTFIISPVKKEHLCGDTALTMYHKRQIILKETNDSLVVLQFSSDAVTWE